MTRHEPNASDSSNGAPLMARESRRAAARTSPSSDDVEVGRRPVEQAVADGAADEPRGHARQRLAYARDGVAHVAASLATTAASPAGSPSR